MVLELMVLELMVLELMKEGELSHGSEQGN
jgi:hypothetical protein